MDISRRTFLAGAGALGGALATGCATDVCRKPGARIALQLYSIRSYIDRVGIAKTLEEVAAIGYTGVEVAGYDAKASRFYKASAAELKGMLDANGLELCGMHISRSTLEPDAIASTCEFARTCGNTTIICPGSGNFPAGMSFKNRYREPAKDIDEWCGFLADFYNKAAVAAAKHGCRVGIHNHEWEFKVKLTDGTTFFDGFFSRTSPDVLMEQDVGWTTAAGYDPCEQYRKYPRRSPTLHAKENGYGCKGKFDGILGVPGRNPDGTSVPGVDWDRLIPVTEADGVAWYIVECEAHANDLSAVTASYAFLKAKGLS